MGVSYLGVSYLGASFWAPLEAPRRSDPPGSRDPAPRLACRKWESVPFGHGLPLPRPTMDLGAGRAGSGEGSSSFTE